MKVSLGRDHVPDVVEIDEYDLWDLDYTLAHIIHPALVKLKNTAHGWFLVDNKDVPSRLRDDGTPDSIEAYTERKWNWVMDEMIWSFEQVLSQKAETDKRTRENRIKHGLILFGKYYRCLWN